MSRNRERIAGSEQQTSSKQAPVFTQTNNEEQRVDVNLRLPLNN